MSDQEREAKSKRFDDLSAELNAIREGRAMSGTDPATREPEIVQEMQEIEWWFEDDDLADSLGIEE